MTQASATGDPHRNAYRPAIDGLRAVAIILVLLFHARVPGFTGGFVGVDVFFVISGYLITGIISREYARGTFTLAGFYERRVRRILPAFFLVVLATLGLGLFILVPSDLSQLGASAVAATTFVSNVFFWQQGENYLSGNTDLMPLLHTWSLGIEEQFYLAFPVCLLLLYRYTRRPGMALLSGTVLSFVACVWLTETHARAAFYLAPTRAWELLLGACIAVSPIGSRVPRVARPSLQAMGLAMILVAGIAFGRQTPFPGVAALLPCLGAALLVAWSDEGSLVNTVLSQPTVVWIGLVSYPLYLWHWPLLVLGRLEQLRSLRWSEVALVYMLTFVLAWATRQYVERYFHGRTATVARRPLLTVVGTALVAVVLMGGTVRTLHGVLGTPPANVAAVLAAADDYASRYTQCQNWDRADATQMSHCILGDSTKAQFDFALWGDSQAGSVALAVSAVARDRGLKGLQFSANNCPPLLHTEIVVTRQPIGCDALNDTAWRLLGEYGIRQVVLMGEWTQYTAGPDADIALRPTRPPSAKAEEEAVFAQVLRGTLDELRGAGIRVTVIGPVPYIGWNVPNVLATRLWRGRSIPPGETIDEFRAGQRAVLTVLGSLETQVLYPHEVLCDARCPVQRDGRVLYSDDEHLTVYGADLLRPMLSTIFPPTQQAGRISPPPTLRTSRP